MRRSFSRLSPLCLLGLLVAMPALAAHEEVIKPLKTVVNSIRYSKDKNALKLFATEEQGKALLGSDWQKGTDAQRKEFEELFQVLFAKIAFPKVREDFKYLDTISYGDATVEGSTATVPSTIIIRHPVKGTQELKLKYTVINTGGAWKVLDVAVLGDSMVKGIREDQIIPIMKDGGWDGLLKAMRDKAKELEKVQLK